MRQSLCGELDRGRAGCTESSGSRQHGPSDDGSGRRGLQRGSGFEIAPKRQDMGYQGVTGWRRNHISTSLMRNRAGFKYAAPRATLLCSRPLSIPEGHVRQEPNWNHL